jgi:hypothetical protein
MLLNHVTPDALACAPFTLKRPTKKDFLRLVEPRRWVQTASRCDLGFKTVKNSQCQCL